MSKSIRFKALLLISVLLLSGCTPSKQYAGNKTDGAFFSVPNGWIEISNADLNKEEGKSSIEGDLERLAMVTYQIGFTKAKAMTAREVFMLEPTEQPVVFARFRDLFPEERNAISLNTLRNIILPITDYLDGSKEISNNFQLYDDQEITERGGKGVNLFYSFDYHGVNQTINQTALYSNDQNKIYLFVVRCSSVCYDKNLKVINEIATSFTVRGYK